MCGWFRRLAGLLLAALAAGAAAAAAPVPESLVLFNREIAELRATYGGREPAERIARAERRFAGLGAAELAQPTLAVPVDADGAPGLLLQQGGRPVFTLLQADLDPEERLSLAQAAERARLHLEQAAAARLAQARPQVWLQGSAIALAVLMGAAAALWAALHVHARVLSVGQATAGRDTAGAATYLKIFALRVLAALVWLVFALLVHAGAVWLLGAFPWTAPWAARLAGFVQQLGGWLATGLMSAVPGLLTVLLVMLVARAVQEALAVFLRHVQSGRIRVPFMHAETVGATRRLLNLLLWGLALAAAYPYLPGAGSEAFKGLSVMFGLMITLGSTGLVTQLMSGLVVVYSRALKKGDFVAVNGVEGVVSEVGALAVKVVTMRNEEITVPHSVITSSNVHNYSKLAGQQGTLVSTRVTIGYDTPWRQVHAMLVAAAARTPGVRAEPSPFVYQRALSDFYVEYELFAHVDKPLERVPIVSALHAAIQDEFNTYGVQIMSPNFYEQPPQPLVVPRERWYEAPARAPGASPERPQGAT